MRYIKYLFALMLVAGLTSCEKFLDVNDNPNSPTTAPLTGLLGGVTYMTGMNMYYAGNQVSYYTQYLASPNPGSPIDVYDLVDASTTWTNIYDNMTDLYDMDNMAAEVGATHYQGVSKIMMAIHLSLLNDIWGDAPYSKAFTLDNPTPPYDNAQDLFNNALSLLDEGVALLQNSNTTVALSNTLDLIHKGDVNAWIRTAYAIKARLLNQLSKRPEYNPTAILQALSNAYQSSTHDAQLTTFNVRNPWAQVAVNNAGLLLDGWLSKNFVDAMNGTTFGVFDPRLPLITNLTKFGDYRGTRNGGGRVGDGTSNEESVLITTGVYSSTNSPLFIATYFEMKFIEAEVTLPTDPARAYDAYLEGIRAHMDKLGVPAAERDDYLNHPDVAVGAGNLTLQRIMDEKYKAMFLHPGTWTDARRFDYQYTGFQLPLGAVLPTYIRRMDYPSVEKTRNGANVPAVSDLTSRLWWDQ